MEMDLGSESELSAPTTPVSLPSFIPPHLLDAIGIDESDDMVPLTAIPFEEFLCAESCRNLSEASPPQLQMALAQDERYVNNLNNIGFVEVDGQRIEIVSQSQSSQRMVESVPADSFEKGSVGLGQEIELGGEIKLTVMEVNGKAVVVLVNNDDQDQALRSNLDHCQTCGCYGLRHEFFNPHYCSEACYLSGNQWNHVEELQHQNAPLKLFKQPALPSHRNPFIKGQVLEALDPDNQSLFCVVSISDVVGWRLELHFEGYSDQFDFWVNADTLDIFPAGWCSDNGYELQPPGDFSGKPKDFNWHTYLMQRRSDPAPRQHFQITKETDQLEEEIVGMKLEAVDIRANNLIICVATVTKVLGHRFLIHFDSWDNIYDYWADVSCPFIFPVGYCDSNGITLTPPNDYKDFEWKKYLQETQSVAMPQRLFERLPPVGFKKGMRIEAVDMRNPRLIRPAIIHHVENHMLTVRYEGWSETYDTKFTELSNDLHPVGYCETTSHPIETVPSKVSKVVCPNFCEGKGNSKDKKKGTHSCKTECPYLAEKEKAIERVVIVFPGGTAGPSAVVQPSAATHNRLKQMGNYSSTARKPAPTPAAAPRAVLRGKRRVSKFRGKSKKSEEVKRELMAEMRVVMMALAQKVMKEKRRDRYLFEMLLEGVELGEMRSWDKEKVHMFVSSLPNCEKMAGELRDQEVDGDALLLLTREDLVAMSVGQGTKVYYAIQIVRRKSEGWQWQCGSGTGSGGGSGTGSGGGSGTGSGMETLEVE